MKKFSNTMAGLYFSQEDDGITSGVYIQEDMKSIRFTDGYSTYPNLDINYCPYCGAKQN